MRTITTSEISAMAPPKPKSRKKLSKLFGNRVFTFEVMEKYLNEEVIEAVKKGQITRGIADEVA
jgi:glutamine synthetase type III